MKNFLPANRLPRSYTWAWANAALQDAHKYGEPKLNIGPNTVCFWQRHSIMPSPIVIEFYGTRIITLYEGGMIVLDDQHMTDVRYRSHSIQRRMDAALQGVGKRLLSRDGRWKIYTISTGAWEDYKRGMTVERDI